MADVYWYISADKIQALKTRRPKWEKLSLNFKLKFLEIETGVTFDNSLLDSLKSLKKDLAKDPSVVPFQDLKPGKEGAIFSFEGEASRMRTSAALWIATQKKNSALLMVGAPRNLAGQSQLKEGYMSPSLDPVGAVKAVAERQETPMLLASLVYAWRTVMQDAISGSAHFPHVEGLAVFAGLFHLDAPLHEDVTGSKIDQIVVGSPIYVRQIG